MNEIDVMCADVVNDTVILTVMVIGSDEAPTKVSYRRYWCEYTDEFVMGFVSGPEEYRDSGILAQHARKAFEQYDEDNRLSLLRWLR